MPGIFMQKPISDSPNKKEEKLEKELFPEKKSHIMTIVKISLFIILIGAVYYFATDKERKFNSIVQGAESIVVDTKNLSKQQMSQMMKTLEDYNKSGVEICYGNKVINKAKERKELGVLEISQKELDTFRKDCELLKFYTIDSSGSSQNISISPLPESSGIKVPLPPTPTDIKNELNLAPQGDKKKYSDLDPSPDNWDNQTWEQFLIDYPMDYFRDMEMPTRAGAGFEVEGIEIHASALPRNSRSSDPNYVCWYHTEKKGFGNCGYHFYIDKDGNILSMRDQSYIAAADNTGDFKNNYRLIQIAVAGDPLQESFSDAQLKSLSILIWELSQQYPVIKDDLTRIKTHTEFAGVADKPAEKREFFKLDDVVIPRAKELNEKYNISDMNVSTEIQKIIPDNIIKNVLIARISKYNQSPYDPQLYAEKNLKYCRELGQDCLTYTAIVEKETKFCAYYVTHGWTIEGIDTNGDGKVDEDEMLSTATNLAEYFGNCIGMKPNSSSSDKNLKNAIVKILWDRGTDYTNYVWTRYGDDNSTVGERLDNGLKDFYYRWRDKVCTQKNNPTINNISKKCGFNKSDTWEQDVSSNYFELFGDMIKQL